MYYKCRGVVYVCTGVVNGTLISFGDCFSVDFESE